jgi:hypothetical protein
MEPPAPAALSTRMVPPPSGLRIDSARSRATLVGGPAGGERHDDGDGLAAGEGGLRVGAERGSTQRDGHEGLERLVHENS